MPAFALCLTVFGFLSISSNKSLWLFLALHLFRLVLGYCHWLLAVSIAFTRYNYYLPNGGITVGAKSYQIYRGPEHRLVVSPIEGSWRDIPNHPIKSSDSHIWANDDIDLSEMYIDRSGKVNAPDIIRQMISLNHPILKHGISPGALPLL